MEIKYWKIGDFAKKLKKHTNTVDGWFRTLEDERKLHYINRVNGEKVYDELDLDIAHFIIEKRNEKWSLNGIYDNLSNYFSLRPFPMDFEHESKSMPIIDANEIRASIMSELKIAFEQVASAQTAQQILDIQKFLPSREQIRLERFNEMVAERKVNRQLEEKALSIWSTKTEEERMKRVGWFRKEEDKDKRDRFVKDYIDKFYEECLKEEFDIEF